LPVPLPGEQRLIVRFLDWHGAQTAKLIRAKKKLIALLNEQKQAIIYRAVTRGLDPNVKLKLLRYSLALRRAGGVGGKAADDCLPFYLRRLFVYRDPKAR
jgi:hypothetical protein